jgi:hypothetical protein
VLDIRETASSDISLATATPVIVAVLLTFAAPTSMAQSLPDYSGTWILDAARSGPPVAVWGQTRATVIVIEQDQDELKLTTQGGGLSVPQDLQRFRLDGVPVVHVDESLGQLVNFVRKVKNQTRWDGRTLTLESEHFSESIDRRTGRTTRRRGITSVLRFQLGSNQRELLVERTGFRMEPPPILHGRAYDRKDDLVYNLDRIHYLKAIR